MVACSYTTRKGNRSRVWRHPFRRRKGRLPNLLVIALTGKERIEAPEHKDMITQGYLVDIELADGRRAIGANVLVGTDNTGRTLFLYSETMLEHQIEQRGKLGPKVGARGIEG